MPAGPPFEEAGPSQRNEPLKDCNMEVDAAFTPATAEVFIAVFSPSCFLSCRLVAWLRCLGWSRYANVGPCRVR